MRITFSRHTGLRGQLLVVLAMCLPAILGAIALVADVGLLYRNWAMLQAAADLAATAGAGYLPWSPSLATSEAQSIALTNGIGTSEIVSISVLANNTEVNVQLRRSVPYSFAVLLGLTSGSVAAQATAQIQTIGAVTGVTPIGVSYDTQYSSGQVVQLMENQVGPGNWDPLALGGTGSSVLQQNIINGYQGQVSIGDYITTEPGVAAGPIRTAFNALISEGQSTDPGGTFSSHTFNDPRVLVVPMVDFSTAQGSSQVLVKGFAVLWLVSVDGKNNVQTYFIDQVVSGGTPQGGATNYGAYTAVLIQ